MGYPDCGLPGYLTLKTETKQHKSREHRRAALLTNLSLWSVPENHDLEFEGKPRQLLAAAAETGECVSYRSMPSLN